MIKVREETEEDRPAIRDLNEKAFGQPQEAELVDKLRENCDNLLSLVAVIENRVVGHILFSPAKISGDKLTVEGMGLAPMAVLPEYQKQGIGSALVRAGLAKLSNMGCPFVIVLGHPTYYPRFGFIRASLYEIRSEWEVPDEAFMLLVLDQTKMESVSGVAKYRPEFAEAM